MSQVYGLHSDDIPVSTLGVNERAAFIGRTYSHLFGAVLGFVFFLMLLFQTPIPDKMIGFLQGGSWRWLLFLGAFMIVGSLASRTAMSARTASSQYLALFGYVLLEALIFVPLIWIANEFAPGAIESAGLITIAGFTGLTAVVFITRKDFSFMKGILGLIAVLALILIVVAIFAGFNLGIWFSVLMVALAGGFVLYETSNVLHHYPVEKHVAASLALFAAIALMFWYVLRIMIAMQQD